MSHDEDYLLALKLQNEFDALDEAEANEWPTVDRPNKRKNEYDDNNLNATQNLVHPEWETIDPIPDIYSLFGAFDIKFFGGKLQCVELEWSKRMYQCAGICYQRSNGLGKSIIIRLSEPLLKLRSRRDLIQTMLHEMIHADLFIKNIREGNGGHGPKFKEKMELINRVAGTNITVYHTFHDEVALYKTHIWRCNGICQHRKPFYGWVKRTSNRAPGPNDNWWAKHHETCGGTFHKVSEPEPKTKAKKSKIDENRLPKITNWLNSSQTNTNEPKTTSNTAKGGGYTKMNGGGTVVLKPTAKNRTFTTVSDNSNTGSVLSTVSDAAAGGNLRNVVGFRDLNDSGSQSSVIRRPTFSSGGFQLGSTTNKSLSSASPSENIRNVWANKFNDNKPPANQASTSTDHRQTKNKTKVTEASSAWEEIDDDILIHSVKNEVIEIDDGSNDGYQPDVDNNTVARDATHDAKPNVTIKMELLDDLGEEDENIEMIDDEFDDTMNESLDLLTDNNVISDLFDTDTLMTEFNNINNVIMSDPENVGNPNMEIIQCPICEDRMARDELSSHLEGCNGITVKIDPKKRGNNSKPMPFYKNHAKPSTSQSSQTSTNERERELLLKAGYTQEQIDRLNTDTHESREYNNRIMNELANDERQRRTSVIRQHSRDNDDIETITLDDGSNSSSVPVPVPEKHPCPVCNVPIDVNQINQHLDECLQSQMNS
ncbi:sprT-like domain-containing protein Spartan [Contarinia nasturtii]|uniref:sprT-like domain-containing protein Spartan n=1 Tax=Contarinia nasturtii TaxID=265458 RepID=UPI0012D39926|nr:sprT-like domain-containing protein Spartan [Contarinia nasturtii]